MLTVTKLHYCNESTKKLKQRFLAASKLTTYIVLQTTNE